MRVKAWVRAMSLLTFPSNQDVLWVVFGWAVLYGAVSAVFSDGSSESIRTFDASPWSDRRSIRLAVSLLAYQPFTYGYLN